MRDRIKIILVTFLMIIAFTGCSKLTRENYDTIKIGMDYEQVQKILGEPDKCDSALGAKNCIWGDTEKNITIKFVADKVAFPTMKGL
ncbi:DUF3862 domain-containing protein [Desulfospira joergensenii]|uniref:DUF3862 domain-containing protein n=1 Tax=Desulfospira joergensenii TaxID=53329 RepID=UPI0003B73C21|nr:DUF3862 domain-containing protein [Desulfospira joergensenii]